MIVTVVGARPNFVKVTPVVHEMKRRGIPFVLVHTGQHRDPRMSDCFFRELGLPAPEMLCAGEAADREDRIRNIAGAFAGFCDRHRPKIVVVSGDVDSSAACTLAAAQKNIPVAHVESGLRSFDTRMPEEQNRISIDHLSEILFTTEPQAGENLVREGIPVERIEFVGNTMIDSLRHCLPASLERDPWARYGLKKGTYGLLTLHRPSNVDNPEKLAGFCRAAEAIAGFLPLLFPVHPRTAEKSRQLGLSWSGVRLMEPAGYLDFLGLMAGARMVLTDSGGIQEETTALGVPCLTLRDNTERPVTVTCGTNQLAGTDPSTILEKTREILAGTGKSYRIPELWDGKASQRVVNILERWLKREES